MYNTSCVPCTCSVSVRRLGLAALFELPEDTLQNIITCGGWQQLQALLLQLLGAFENDKLVSEMGAGSATSKQAQAVQVLQEQLQCFVTNCITIVYRQQQQQDLVADLVTAYLDRVVEVSKRAATAWLLIQALLAAVRLGMYARERLGNGSRGGSSGKHGSTIVPLCRLTPQQLLSHVGGVLAHTHYLHPAHLRLDMQLCLLELVPACCSARDCGADAALSVLAAAGSAAAVKADWFLRWLDSALTAPAAAPATAAAAVAAGSGTRAAASAAGCERKSGASAAPCITRLQAWLCPIQQYISGATDLSGCTSVLPAHKLLYCLGEIAADLSQAGYAVRLSSIYHDK